MTTEPSAAAGWETAPSLIEGAKTLQLDVRTCDLPYWFGSVAQGTLAGRAGNGHSPGAPTPDHMRKPGPLRDALMLELGCRSVAEEKATRILGQYVTAATGLPEMNFFATQLIDEARHCHVFRNHLVEMGVPASRLTATIAALTTEYTAEVLDPVEEFAMRVVRDEGDFIGGVAVFTIVIEGVLAPAAELSERKWDRLDPAASEIAKGAGIDEIRHLTVGSSVVREHLLAHPDYLPRLTEILDRGRELWDRVPDSKYVLAREELFTEGMRAHESLLADYEVWPGRRLLDTTGEERYAKAEQWTDEMAEVRMTYMGLDPALAKVG